MCELNGESGRRTSDILQRGPIAGPRKHILSDKNCAVKRWRNRGRIDTRRQLRACAVQATALFTDFRGIEGMKMEGQEENKKQYPDTENASEVLRFLHTEDRHRLNLANQN